MNTPGILQQYTLYIPLHSPNQFMIHLDLLKMLELEATCSKIRLYQTTILNSVNTQKNILSITHDVQP